MKEICTVITGEENNNTQQEFTLAKWLDEWLVTYKQCSVKNATYLNYSYAVSLIKKTLSAKIPLSQITELILQKTINEIYLNKSYQNHSKSKYSKSTLKTVRITLRQAFRTAMRLHIIDNDVSEYLVLPDAFTKIIKPLTIDEQILVENACKNDPLGHLFIFLLRTGLRRTELINLKWTDYDFINQEIFIRKSKTKAGIRTVSLLNEVNDIILQQPHINEYIFNCTKNTPITESVMKKLYLRLRKKTGVMHLTNHVCRHTFVTRLCEKGVSAKAIAQIIGHSRTDYVMDIYALIEKEQLKFAIYKLDDNMQFIDSKYTVQLPPALYRKVSTYAISNGIALDKFITEAIHEKMKV